MVTNNHFLPKSERLLTTEVCVLPVSLYCIFVSVMIQLELVLYILQTIEVATVLNVAQGSGNGEETVGEIVTGFSNVPNPMAHASVLHISLTRTSHAAIFTLDGLWKFKSAYNE